MFLQPCPSPGNARVTVETVAQPRPTPANGQSARNGVRMDFAEALTAAMDSRGIGVRELARGVPCNAGYVSQLRSGRKQPSPELAAKLDEVLGAGGQLAAPALPVHPAGPRH